jgi:hypothetical protein
VARRRRFDIRQASKQILLVLGVLLALNLAFYIFFVRPSVREYDKLRVDSEPRFEQLEERRERVEEREAYLTAVKQAQVDLKRLRQDVLSTREERMVEVQLELARLTEQFGISLESVDIHNQVLEGEELDRMEMVVPLEGGYANLRRLLQSVEASDKFFVVERVALVQGKEGGALLQLNITLATYFTATPQLLRQERRP